jgi:hypothetical protein
MAIIKYFMKITICILFMVCSFKVCSQDLIYDKEMNFKKAIVEFIDTTNSQKYLNGSKYSVFVMNCYRFDSISKEFCVSIGYILNSYEYKYIAPSHFFTINDKIVLVRIEKGFDISVLEKFDPKIIDDQDKIAILEKLYPEGKGGITYSSQGLIYCESAGKSIKEFFENSDEIPMENSKYKNFPSGRNIRTIKKIN